MKRYRVVPVLLAFLLWLPTSGDAAAAEPAGPDPALTPGDVVAIQLDALQNNDDPQPNAGIARTFAFAHPDNKRVTGPLPRFERMIRSPAYRALIDHAAHQIERVEEGDDFVRFKVVVETPNGRALTYLWEVRRVGEGSHEGSWLTTNVSAPADAGRAL